MAKAIGIDLGTTNCCVSVMEGGKPKVIATKEGARTIPSIVAFTARGERLVGQIAKRQALTNPTNTIYAIKRLVGRKFDSPEVAKAAQLVPYQIVPSKNGDAWMRVRDKDYSPPELSAFLLQHLRELAEDYLGTEVNEAVITVPAYFDDAQRQATKDSGRIAGLNVLRIVNEPTSASLAYGMDEGTAARKIAVYDLGGGTFDISILQLGEGVFEVKSTSGDTFLGGEDFDQAIARALAEEIHKEHGVNPFDDPVASQRLLVEVEAAKRQLTSLDEAIVGLPFLAMGKNGPVNIQRRLTSAEFESLTEHLIDRLAEPCLTALADAKLEAIDIDDVLLVVRRRSKFGTAGGRGLVVLEHGRDLGGEATGDLDPGPTDGHGACEGLVARALCGADA